ncbi:activating signal cointegrator 1 complex subunit 2 homolog [Mangifera indica]|uniref:activating signal cointegrator 1 complex subunit 2 homolog n=1 Tax=Mangifera indica TaxID=29780 RepID=UPI001CFBF4D5|nr:activating signal cointegrator 1 complex subunit 2 homolog [Mangifera indica]
MASGSSGRANPISKGFDFASDDILCSYEDYADQDSTNGNHSDPVISSSSNKEFQKSRRSRPSVYSGNAYSQPEESLNQDITSMVELTMKKHTDNLMRFLEGISSRLSQLELYCYNLDKSMGEMRSELGRDHSEADTKLKSLEKHIQEVHRSVQIIRDKQELIETQKELAKLQLVQKESSSSSHLQSTEERASPTVPEGKKKENASDMHNQQLALALPHQVAPQQQPVALPSQPPPQNVTRQQSYYMPTNQIPNPPAPAPALAPSPIPASVPVPVPSQQPQSQYLTSDPQYRTSQVPDPTRLAPQVTHSQVNTVPPGHQFPQQYQQQWPQQLPQPVQQSQQPSMQPQIRSPSTTVYPTYASSQPTPPPPEMLPNSGSMQVSYSGVSQPVSSRADAMPYGYGAPGRTAPQQAPSSQQIKGGYRVQPGDGYASAGPLPTPGSAYIMYEGEGGRTHHPSQQSHYPPGGYPPPNPQPTVGANLMSRPPSHSQFIRNHPYNELIEKLVSMGFRGDVVASVIQRMEESGQPVDFNAVLDRLNLHPSGGSHRGWSG